MKIIYPNLFNLAQSTVSNGLPGFPLTNLTDEHLQKSFMADTSQSGDPEVLVDFEILSDSSALALFGVEAESIRVDLYSDPARSQLVESQSFNLTQVDQFGTSNLPSLWMEYSPLTGKTYGRLVISTLSITRIKLGVAAAGPLHAFGNPTWGLNHELQDYAVIKELRNGAEYTKPRGISTLFSGALEIPTQGEGRAQYYALMRFRKRVGPSPFACVFVDGLKDHLGNNLDLEYALWGRFQEFQATEGSYSHSTLQMTLKEFL